MTKIFIGTPSIDQKVNVGYLFTIFNTNKLLPDIEIELFVLSGNSCITDARNQIVSFFYNHNTSDYLLFLDSDVEINVEEIKKLISAKKDIIGIPVMKKNILERKINMGSVLQIVNDNELNLEMAEVDGISTSCLLISRKVIKSFIQDKETKSYSNSIDDVINMTNSNLNRIYEIFKTGITNDKFISEDYFFCKQAKEKYGYKTYTILNSKSNHFGTVPFDYQFKM